MAKNITLMGANYPDVPAVVLPQTGGGNAVFVDAEEVGNIEEAIAIVIDGDTAPQAITAGQYLFIKNHSTLATGGYHATANIASGGSVSSSNTAADANGLVNAVNNKISQYTSLYSNADTQQSTTLILNDNIYNYNFVAIRVEMNGWTNELLLPKAMLDNKKHLIPLEYNATYFAHFEFMFISATTAQIIVRESSSAWASMAVGLNIIGLMKL